MKYKATELIARYFENNDIKFNVETPDDTCEILITNFRIDPCPNVTIKFVSAHDDNDVNIRLFQLVTGVPDDKRPRILEACNFVNNKYRFLKYVLDKDGDINLHYDCPLRISDDNVGAVAEEILICMLKSVQVNYPVFMRALYSSEPIE